MPETTNEFGVELGLYTIIYYDHHDKILFVATNVTGNTVEDAIDKGLRNHVPKERRVSVDHAVAFDQWKAAKRKVTASQDYRIEAFEVSA